MTNLRPRPDIYFCSYVDLSETTLILEAMLMSAFIQFSVFHISFLELISFRGILLKNNLTKSINIGPEKILLLQISSDKQYQWSCTAKPDGSQESGVKWMHFTSAILQTLNIRLLLGVVGQRHLFIISVQISEKHIVRSIETF